MTPDIDTRVRFTDDEGTERFAVVIANSPAQQQSLSGAPEGTVSLAITFPSATAPSIVMTPDRVPYSATPLAGHWTPL